MDEQHAVLMQPDLAGLLAKMHARTQVVASLIACGFAVPARFAHTRPFFLI